MKRDTIELLFAIDEDVLFADNLDDAIIGFDQVGWRVVYSKSKCVEVMSRDMPVEEAIDYLNYNTYSAYVGPKTPIWVDDEVI